MSRHAPGLAEERRNTTILATCQALLLSVNATVVALNGLAGYQLATDKSLATLPVTCWVLGGAMATFPASFLMKRVGRRGGFTVGASIGLIGTATSVTALWMGSFWLLCLGTLTFGMCNGFGQYFRFAAAEAAGPEFRSKAISLVLAGGLVGGFVGPSLSTWTVGLHSVRYLASYASTSCFLVLMLGMVQALRLPEALPSESSGPSRPLLEIARQPAYTVAVISAAIGYGVMNFLMTATPLAMGFCGHPYGAAAGVIGWHIVGMYAPSLVTGGLIRRFGTLPIMLAGAALVFCCVGIALTGITVAHFWWSLLLLGVGWNCLYVGATTLITTTYEPAEKAKAQGANEIAIFLTMVTSSYSSGLLLNHGGWTVINQAALPFVTIATVLLLWLMSRERRAVAAA